VCATDERVGAAVVEEPAALEKYHTFGEGGAGFILAGGFPIELGLEERVVEPRDEFCGIVFVEECLAAGVGTGGQARIAVGGLVAVLAVVNQNDAVLGRADGVRPSIVVFRLESLPTPLAITPWPEN
jgi:hypothetical protein